MGCDIHFHFEAKNKSGSWKTVNLENNPLDKRNYMNFAFLAGVRNNFPIYIKSLGFHQGLPEDLSLGFMQSWWCRFGEKNFTVEDFKKKFSEKHYHTYHWVTLQELAQFKWETPFLNYIDTTGYNDDYNNYPEILKKLIHKRVEMSAEQAIEQLAPFYFSHCNIKNPTQITIGDYFGEDTLNFFKMLFEKYPEGRLIYYFDN